MLFVVTVIVFVGVAVSVFIIARTPARAPTVSTNESNVNRTFTTNVPSQHDRFNEFHPGTFVSSTPKNNTILQATPLNVTVVFSSPIGPSSTMVLKDEQEVPVNLGKAKFSDDRMSMISDVASGATGAISVSYTACTPDNSQCPTGTFGFSITP